MVRLLWLPGLSLVLPLLFSEHRMHSNARAAVRAVTLVSFIADWRSQHPRPSHRPLRIAIHGVLTSRLTIYIRLRCHGRVVLCALLV